MHPSIFSGAHASPPPPQPPGSLPGIGELDDDDGKGSVNVFIKMNLHFSNFVAFIQTCF